MHLRLLCDQCKATVHLTQTWLKGPTNAQPNQFERQRFDDKDIWCSVNTTDDCSFSSYLSVICDCNWLHMYIYIYIHIHTDFHTFYQWELLVVGFIHANHPNERIAALLDDDTYAVRAKACFLLGKVNATNQAAWSSAAVFSWLVHVMFVTCCWFWWLWLCRTIVGSH